MPILHVPLYRWSRNEHNRKKAARLTAFLHGSARWPMWAGDQPPGRTERNVDYFEKQWSTWEYNATIGFLEIFAGPPVISADLYLHECKRFSLRTPKSFRMVHAEVISVMACPGDTNDSIARELVTRVEQFKVWDDVKFMPDTSALQHLSKYVNWTSLTGIT